MVEREGGTIGGRMGGKGDRKGGREVDDLGGREREGGRWENDCVKGNGKLTV